MAQPAPVLDHPVASAGTAAAEPETSTGYGSPSRLTTSPSGEKAPDLSSIVRLVILGPPRTKKNHMRIVKTGSRARLIQSREAMLWADRAVLQLRCAWRLVPLDRPVNLRALVFRDRDTGDLGNYLAAVCDALERAGVVVNDRLIGGFDGSRLLVDRDRPRVELTLSDLR